MTWKNSVTPAEVVDLLNDLMRRDFAAVRALFELRVSCNAELASHPTVQVKFEDAGGEAPIQFDVGLLGILNGLFGVDDQKRGVIRSVHDSMLGLQRFELAPEYAIAPSEQESREQLLARLEAAEAKAAVIGGEACIENRKAGRGPCGACAVCCADLRKELEEAKAAARATQQSVENAHECIASVSKVNENLGLELHHLRVQLNGSERNRASLRTEYDRVSNALESKVNALRGEVRDEWIRRQTVERDRDSARAERDAAVAANVQLTAIVEQLQREKMALEASLVDAQQQYAATTTERLVLLSAYAMNYGAVRVSEEFALRYPVKVSTCRHGGVYEVVGTGLPNNPPGRLGTLVLLAVRRVTATASADDTYALLQALACPAICAADPVKLGTAATELADLVNALRGSRAFSSVMSRDARAEELTRCCRMLIPLLDEATQREVIRRMEGSAEPTRVRTHDRDCLCQQCLDEAGRGR